MTIIVFLVDTSASMCQRALVNGVQKSYLDIAKGAVETFLKFRQRSQDCMGDRYMLLTFEDPPNNVKAGWKENHATFMNELKNLQSNGLTSMGEALKNAFDLLNLNRMQSGIDTYGQGRCPFYLEPSVIIVLTDGGKYTFRNGVHQEIILPLHAQMPGTKLTKEPFRWDQRLFSLVLRIPGHRVEERTDGKVPHDESMIEKMCEVTGGRSYKIRSHYVLNQCIESLVQKVQPGVVIHFDQLISANNGDGGGGGGASGSGNSGGNSANNATSDLQFQSTKRMIYVPKQHPSQKTFPVGYWPIPEPYWPDPKLTSLPPRDAHPKIKIMSPCCDEPQVLRNFPIDKYELEASPLTLQILSKKELNKVWPLIVSTGMQGEMPFGYLKPNSTLPIVHLYVLPYNYQMLLPLINDLFHKFNLNPPNDWVYKFTNYVKTIPQYYCPFLRRALATMPNVPYQLVQYILPENLDSYLCPAVANYLKQMKNTAKQDQENLCLRVLKQLKQPKPAYHQLETAKLTCLQPMRRDIVTHPMLKDTFTKMHAEIATYENYTIVVPSIIQTASTKNYRNPYDIPRRDLIDEIARMRENFFQLPPSGINVYTKDSGHCLPIADMGNYQEYLKNKEVPLRELEPTNVRQHMFGNPYKKDKNMVMVDEADLNDLAPLKSGGGGGGGLAGGGPSGPGGLGGPGGPSGLGGLVGGGIGGGGGGGGVGGGGGGGGVGAPHLTSHMKKSLELATGAGRLSRKRKAGPIRKDYVFKRSALDVGDGGSSSAGSSCACSLAGDDVQSGDGLLTDDETGSEFSAGSDGEDDTEGCLVMALDAPDEPMVDGVATATVPAAGTAVKAYASSSLPPIRLASLREDEASEKGEEKAMEEKERRTPDEVKGKAEDGKAPDAASLAGTSEERDGEVSSTVEGSRLEQTNEERLEEQEPNGDEQLVTVEPNTYDADKQMDQTELPVADATEQPDRRDEVHEQHEPSKERVGSTNSDQRVGEVSPVEEQIASGVETLPVRTEEHPPVEPVCNDTSATLPVKSEPESVASSVDECLAERLEQPEPAPAEPSKPSHADQPQENATALGELSAAQPSQQPVAIAVASGEGPPVVALRKPSAAAAARWTNLDAGSDMTDVLKISNILKTCHNGGGDTGGNDRDKQASPDGGVPHESKPDPNTSGPSQPGHGFANGALTVGLVNGGGGGGAGGSARVDGGPLQPAHAWDYTYNLYTYADDEQLLEQIEEANLKTRAIVFRDIRRPGRNYGQLLKHLELVQGNRPTQKQFVDMCVREAQRFRRHRMVECIQSWWANRSGGGRKTRSMKPEPDGGTGGSYYNHRPHPHPYDDSEEEQENHAPAPDNLYFANSAALGTGSTAVGPTAYSGAFRSTTPPAAAYVNSNSGAYGGTGDFTHSNNHHAAPDEGGPPTDPPCVPDS